MKSTDAPLVAPPGSITRLFPLLKNGDRTAVQALWPRVFPRLLRVAASRLNRKLCRSGGPDDLANVVFLKFCDRLARPNVEQRFPRLENRTRLWNLLACFTRRAAYDFNKKMDRQREIVGGESAFGTAGVDQSPGREPDGAVAAAVDDLLGVLSDDLRRVALLKMEGYTNREVAREIGRSETAVELRLRHIRAIWTEKGLAP
jgi:DNA-directed RNA polymerase specialized sigma24 family protein